MNSSNVVSVIVLVRVLQRDRTNRLYRLIRGDLLWKLVYVIMETEKFQNLLSAS